MNFGLRCRIVEPRSIRVQFVHHVAHETAPAQQVSAKLFDELLEACLALRALTARGRGLQSRIRG